MSAEAYIIQAGVRKAFAAYLLGYPTVAAELTDRLGGKTLRRFDVPVQALHSPKRGVDFWDDATKDRWFVILDLMRRSPGTMPPLRVRRGTRGTPIALVTFDLGFGP